MVFNLHKIEPGRRREPDPQLMADHIKHYTDLVKERFKFTITEENAAGFEAVLRTVAHLHIAKDDKCDVPERGLFLFGEPGTGKTSMMHFLSGFCNIPILSADELSKAFTLQSGEGFWGVADSYKQSHLIVDDLGCEELCKSFGNTLPMADFLRERERLWQNSQKLTFFTSNAHDRNVLTARYGKNVYSRLLGMCEFIAVGGPDHRPLRRA